MSVMQTEMPDNDNLSMEWDPFSDEQIEGLFFPGGGRAEMLEQLQHLLRYGSSLTVLAGEPGVGKGFLVDNLLQQLDPELFDVADIQADVMMTFEQLLHLLDDPWRSLRPFTLENFQEMVPAVATAADDESKTLLCIIQDAEQLNSEVIEQLQVMLGASAGLPVKCLLVAAVGEVENSASLHGLIGAMPDSHVLYLDPLTREQVEEYLHYRMHTAGLGQVSFSAQQVERIFNSSLGNMAHVNEAAREILLEALPAPKPKAKVSTARPALPTMHIVALVVLLAAVLVFWQMGGSHKNEDDAHTLVLNGAAKPAVPATKAKPAESPFVQVAQVNGQSTVSSPAKSAAGKTVSEQTVSGAASPESPASVPQNTMNSASLSASQPVVSSATPNTETPVVSKPENKAVTETKAEPPAKQVEPVQSTVASKPKPTPVTKPVAKSVSRVAAGDPRVAWLKGLPPDHYMLQLMGAEEKETVDRFLGQHPSLQHVVFYSTLRKGKRWYIVVQGNYPDYDAAKGEIRKMSASLQRENPWVRKVGAIQQELIKP